ncbi:MAG: hypothetical protein HKN88_06760 [Gammaproteobacteria bacterium]|nr:hypothetical protein [Gammaproteobacteria bacterium]NNC97758.1 hypothetical protein [Gammaproteobacteria bacterium]NNM13933.1 hypothetical protein [Gammaproteobacteria bacterium]
MLFRRVKQHIQNENWFAVFIDFLIVVIGVYIGIQLGNWNEARAEADEYQRALARFSAEINTNLATLDNLDKEIVNYLNIGSKAFDTLLKCEDSPENRKIVNTGLTAITGTYGLSIRSSALNELTSSETLLSQQSATERERFNQTKFYLDLVTREASFIETIPLEERVQNNPIIVIGEVFEGNVTYTGADFSRKQRTLELGVPLSEACKNDELIKSFYTWERWQGVLPTLSRLIRKELEQSKQILEKPE